MKTIPSIILSLLFATTAATTARSAETFRTDINPALQYYQAFLGVPWNGTTNQDFLLTNEWRGQPLNEHFGYLVSNYDFEFVYLRHAAKATVPCDWGIDLSPGPDTRLPHLSRIKTDARVARYRAMWDLQNGRQTDAKDDLLAALYLARNLSRDGTQISVLVQIAMESVIISAVAENFYQLTPETLRQLTDGFDAAPTRGTIAATIQSEKNRDLKLWLARIAEIKVNNPGNEAAVMERIKQLFRVTEDPSDPDAILWRQILLASGGTSDGVVKLIRDMQPYYQRLSVILTLPWPEYELPMQEFSADIQQSKNPLILEFIPPITKSRNREFNILAKLAMLRAAVEYKLHGAAGFNSVADPLGNGPFTFERFIFGGADRGFKLTSAYNPSAMPGLPVSTNPVVPVSLIFVEKDGPAFNVDGANIGKAVTNSAAK